jgi:hypothetical protein
MSRLESLQCSPAKSFSQIALVGLLPALSLRLSRHFWHTVFDVIANGSFVWLAHNCFSVWLDCQRLALSQCDLAAVMLNFFVGFMNIRILLVSLWADCKPISLSNRRRIVTLLRLCTFPVQFGRVQTFLHGRRLL